MADEQSTGIAAYIERWWEDHFPGSAVARDTAAWNVAHAAKEALKQRLATLSQGPPAASGEAPLCPELKGSE